MCNHFATAPFAWGDSIRRLSNTFIYLCYLKTSKPRCARELHLIRQLRCHLVPYKCSQIGRSYLLHLFFRMIREAVGLSKAHLGADAFYCHRREVRQPTPCCMRPSKQVVPFIERHTCNKLGWDR